MYKHILEYIYYICSSSKKRKNLKCHLMALLSHFRLKGNDIVTENIVYLNINSNLSRNEIKIQKILFLFRITLAI